MTVLEAVNGGAVTKYNLLYLGIPGAFFEKLNVLNILELQVNFSFKMAHGY